MHTSKKKKKINDHESTENDDGNISNYMNKMNVDFFEL